MSSDKIIMSLEDGAFGKLQHMIAADNLHQVRQMSPERIAAIDNDFMSQLAGEQERDPSILPEPSWRGTFAIRSLHVKSAILNLIGYPNQFQELKECDSWNPSDKLRYKITYYSLDLHICHERFKKLVHDASHMLKPDYESIEIWKGSLKYGQPQERADEILKPLMAIRDNRNSITHHWDYSDPFLERLSLFETMMMLPEIRKEHDNPLIEKHKALFGREIDKWSAIAEKNAAAVVEIANMLAEFLEPRLDL